MKKNALSVRKGDCRAAGFVVCRDSILRIKSPFGFAGSAIGTPIGSSSSYLVTSTDKQPNTHIHTNGRVTNPAITTK